MTDWTPPAPAGDDGPMSELFDLLTRRPEWHHQAACHGQTHKMFPENNLDSNEGRRICAGCPVRTPCDEQATANEEVYGTWGGVSGRRRRNTVRTIRRQTRAGAA